MVPTHSSDGFWIRQCSAHTLRVLRPFGVFSRMSHYGGCWQSEELVEEKERDEGAHRCVFWYVLFFLKGKTYFWSINPSIPEWHVCTGIYKAPYVRWRKIPPLPLRPVFNFQSYTSCRMPINTCRWYDETHVDRWKLISNDGIAPTWASIKQSMSQRTSSFLLSLACWEILMTELWKKFGPGGVVWYIVACHTCTTVGRSVGPRNRNTPHPPSPKNSGCCGDMHTHTHTHTVFPNLQDTKKSTSSKGNKWASSNVHVCPGFY